MELTGSNFTASDHITGGAGSDTIQLVDTTGIVVTDAAFAQVSGIETLQLLWWKWQQRDAGRPDADANVGGRHPFNNRQSVDGLRQLMAADLNLIGVSLT